MAKENGVAVKREDLAKALDTALEELTKSSEGGHAPWKGASGAGKGPEHSVAPGAETKDVKGDEAEEEKKKKKEAEEARMKKDEEDKKKAKEEEEALKAGRIKGATDTLVKSEAVKNSVEVSKFLAEIVKSIGEMVGEINHRLAAVEKSQGAFAAGFVKSVGAQNEMIKSMAEQIEEFGSAPLLRKSLPSGAVLSKPKPFRTDLAKSTEGGEPIELSKSQIADRLCTLEIGGKVPVGTTAKFEVTGQLSKGLEDLVQTEPKE